MPQSLVHFGALEYSDKLYELLNKNHMFQNGDREEIEIRGCSIHAVELIREELKLSEIPLDDQTLQVNSTMIDFFLWEYRRRFAADLARIPYHKVRCIYYWLLFVLIRVVPRRLIDSEHWNASSPRSKQKTNRKTLQTSPDTKSIIW